MQSPHLHSPSPLPIHTPVTRLITALKEAENMEEDAFSRGQLWSGGLGFLLAVLGLGIYLLNENYWKVSSLATVSLGAVGGGIASSAIFAFLGTKEIWLGLKRFEVDALKLAEPRIRERHRLAERIGGEFDAKQIAFARAYLKDSCQGLRYRIGMGVGALEKVGILPLTASTLVALAKMYESSQFAVNWVIGALVLLLFYLGAIRILGAVQTIERLLLVLDHAEAYAVERAPRDQLGS